MNRMDRIQNQQRMNWYHRVYCEAAAALHKPALSLQKTIELSLCSQQERLDFALSKRIINWYLFTFLDVMMPISCFTENGLSSECVCAKRSKKSLKVVLLCLFCAIWRLTDTKHFLMCSMYYKCIKCKCIKNTSTPANCTKKLHLIEGFIRFYAAPPAVCHMN